MVVSETSSVSWGSDVVLLVESTANLFPFVESIKTNYIVPTLEYFNGAPADDRDFGYDSISNCSYTLLTFNAADSAPEPACCTVTPPTSSIGKVLSAFDKLLFAGGAAEQFSHITEGLATALQVFDDLAAFKGGSKTGSKHCILVCNSPPYLMPVLETMTYQGQTLEQLAAMMQEKSITLSVFSPRKMPQLCKLFEKAGGDLIGTLAKNYAKDKRHLILPSGFTLAERPATPPPESRLAPASPRSPANVQKRAAPPGSSPPRESKIFKQPGSVPSPQQVPVPSVVPQTGVQRGQAPTPPQLGGMNQPNPPNMNIRQFNADVRSPGGGRLSGHWNNPSPPVSTPSPTGNMSLLQSQLSTAPMRPQNAGQFPQNQMYRPRMVGPGMGGPQPQNQGSPGMVYGNQQMMSNMNQMNQQGMVQQNMGQQGMGQMNPQQPQQGGIMNQNMAPAQNNQMGGPNNNMMPVNQPNMSGPGGGMGPQGGPPQQGMNRRTEPIWRGDVEYQDRSSNQQQKNGPYKLQCIVASQVNQQNEVDVNAALWPEKMQLQLLPRALLMNVMPLVKNAARCVTFNFQPAVDPQGGSNEQALSNLCRLMSNSSLGFIHLTPPCDIKVIIVVYMPDKNTFMGLIANEQDNLLNAIKQVFSENHKRAQGQQQQQQKNKMMMGHGGPNQMGPQGAIGPPQQGQMGAMSQGNIGPQNPMMQQGPGPMPGQMNQMGMNAGPPNQMVQRMGMPQQGGMNPQQGGMNQQQAMNPQAVNQVGGPMGPMNMGGGQPMIGNQGASMMPQGPVPQSSNTGDFAAMEAERKQNLLKIQQLQQTLEAAQQKELQYKQQQAMPGPGGQVAMIPQGGPRPMGSGPQMRGMAPQGPQNPQLRHLLQQQVHAQQQMRAQMMAGPQGQPGQPQQQMYPQQNQQYMQNYNQQF